MDQLELRRITLYPCASAADIVVLVGTFRIPAGLRVAEAAISSQQARILCYFSYSFYAVPIRDRGLLFTYPFLSLWYLFMDRFLIYGLFIFRQNFFLSMVL